MGLLDILNDVVGFVLGWKMCINCGHKVKDELGKRTICPKCGSECDAI